MEPTPTPSRGVSAAPRLVLRPGLRVVRRDDRHLQVGLDAPQRLVVEDRPDVRRVLARLGAGHRPSPATPDGHRVLERLLGLGLLVDADLLDAALDRTTDPDGPERATVLASFARHGDDAAPRLVARAGATVVLDAAAQPGAEAIRLLRAAGIGRVLAHDPGQPVTTAAVALVVAAGEPSRERLDAFVRAGVPHLLLSGGAGGVTTGPFVVPGVTACVRCLDAHRGEHDPRRAVVLEQCARTGGQPVDPALLAAGVAGAVVEVVSLVDGDRPVTWSATVTLDGLLPVVRPWSRHPHCGCTWDALARAG
jgi:hypothetical protein